MKKFLSLIFSLVAIAALAQTPDTLTPEKNARYKIGRIRDNTIRAITPQDFRSAFNSVADMAAKRVPYLTQKEVRDGKADTSQVVSVNYNGRVWAFRYDPASAAPDDSATVLRNGNRRYVIVSDVITPQMFGVKNDGTDESALMQKAHARAITLKKPLYMPEGNYIGYVSLVNQSGHKIYGSGPGTVWKLPNGVNRTLFQCRGCSNVTISDITFDGNAANNPTRQTASVGDNNINDNIYLSRGSNLRVERTYHINSTGNGINAYKVVDFHFDYNSFKNCNRLDQNHITVQFGFTDETTKDNGGSVSFNLFDGNPTGFGMSAFSAHELVATGNIARSCLVAYGSEYGGSKNSYTYNKAFDCGKALVLTSTEDFGRRGEYNIVSHNQFLRCTGSGTGMVQLSGQNYLKFDSNIITGAVGNTNVGIYAQVIRDSELFSNSILGMGSDGIFFPTGSFTSQRFRVHNNDIYGNGGNGIYVAGGDRFSINNNDIFNNNTSAIKVQNCTRLVLSTNFLYDNQTTPTQQYAIIIQDCTDIDENDNTYSFNLYQPDVNLQGTNSRHHIGRRINLQRSRASVQPTTGSWGVGDVVTSSVLTKGKPIGWRCIVAGTPGTWEIIGIYGNGPLRVTSAERAALTPTEGDTVFQTDGTKGMYQYLSGAWVAL